MFDVKGKPVGAFIGLVQGGSEIAIRHDGVFVWHRRVLPEAAVAAVLPEHGPRGAVVLNLDKKTLKRASGTRTGRGNRLPSSDDDVSPDEVALRLAPYVTARDRHEEVELSAASCESHARHLLFVPTTHGYELVEQDGDTPVAFDELALDGFEDVFRVIKVAHSPLPADARLCAYLERQ